MTLSLIIWKLVVDLLRLLFLTLQSESCLILLVDELILIKYRIHIMSTSLNWKIFFSIQWSTLQHRNWNQMFRTWLINLRHSQLRVSQRSSHALFGKVHVASGPKKCVFYFLASCFDKTYHTWEICLTECNKTANSVRDDMTDEGNDNTLDQWQVIKIFKAKICHK